MSQNCSNFIGYTNSVYPWKYNSQSKSATCQTGRTYKFIVTFNKGREYKISFYASSIFDNRMNFKITDESSGEVFVDKPGETELDSKKGSVLMAPMDMDTGEQLDYPSFSFIPLNTLRLQIEIDIEKFLDDEGAEDKRRGCIGVLIYEKKLEGNEGFE
ncbi:MAG: hypothetical protein CSA05_01390 [Bacteroidia bacterium]|nr:MAG: hypothetical protein CSA05_01390 [Bacteroidia bacterium]